METKWRWLLVTAIAPIAWGSNYFVTRQFLPLDYPLWGSTLRALPAGLLLLALARSVPRGAWWWKSLVLGALNVGAFFVLIYIASHLLPSSVAATIMASSAGVLLLLAWPMLSEHPTWTAALGAGAGFAGVCVLLLDGGSAVNPVGVLASVVAMLMSSVGYILARKWAARESTIAMTSWQLVAGGLLLLPFAAFVEGPPPALDGPALAGFAYVTVIATAVAFVAWFSGLRHLPAATVGLVGLLNPVTGVLLGTLVAAEPFGARQLIGAGLVVAGVLIGQRRRRVPTGPSRSGRMRCGSCSRWRPGSP
ncbi:MULTISPECIES: DMT family transporter [unclassified Cryobacterium]|uniref:DMT family transporter n=2 Tax=Cryobacterium TaxID=69578 RepID=UPI002AB3CA6D|nr:MULTISPECIES: EamA family transporter [unclassified Cryobacterium]MDY7527295.1 EamA family transporter [Cryobacterium sp. 10C2]MDY7556918.1 EamA family transporter [Cryobacterium sp. 10C3]MEB0003393.1 EamA family transporter [Cryobacterium sp. RTC2.1]MEB0201367.1 EamA family transporter [Cryobacterium sp. 5I3]MEB0285835.1 EamA family transporter [Cryobacterium sp. 10S3]